MAEKMPLVEMTQQSKLAVLTESCEIYRPTEDDMEDVLKYKHQEENRATEVFGNLQPVREFIRKYGKGKKNAKV